MVGGTEGHDSGPRHRPHPVRCAHGRAMGRYCRACVRARRSDSAELKRLVRHLSPEVLPEEPSTYSLLDDVLREHGNDLHASGWSVEEIEARLAITRRPS